MSSEKNTYFLRFAHIFMYAFASVLVIFAIAISAVRLYPNVSDIVEAEIQYHLGNALNAEIQIESLEISQFHPLSEIVAKNVRIIDRSNQEVMGSVHLAQVRLDLLASLLTRSIRIQLIALDGLDLFIHRDKDGKFHMNQTFLMQGGNVSDEDANAYKDIDLSLLGANIRLKDDLTGTDYLFEDIDISIDPTLDGHRLFLQGILPESIGSYLKLKIDIDGGFHALEQAEIDFYLYAEKFRLSEFAKRILDEEDASKIPVILTTEAWGSVENASLRSLKGYVSASDIVDKPNSKGPEFCLSEDYIREISMQYDWENKEGNWVFKATNILIETDTKDWNETELYIQQDKSSNDKKTIFAYLEEADIGEVCNTLASYSPHIVKFQNQLDQFRFNSNLNDLKVRFDLSKNYQTSFQYSASISHAKAWFAEGDRSIDGLNALLQGGDLGGQVQINSDALKFNMPELFPDLDVRLNAEGDITWMQYADSYSVQSTGLKLKNQDIELLARLDFRKQDENIYTDSQFHVVRASANRIGAYFPSIARMSNTKSWFMKAIEEGAVTKGDVLLRGNLKKFPFLGNSGVFKLDVKVDNGKLEYLSGWPKLTNVQASIKGNKNRIDIYSNQAKMYENTQINDVHVYIDNFDMAVLNINGVANGPTQNINKFLADSGLLGQEETVNQVTLYGDSRLQLSINKPLSKKISRPTSTTGEIIIQDNVLNLHASNLEIKKLNGSVLIDDGGFAGTALTASIYDKPFSMSLEAQGNGASILYFEGDFDLGAYLKEQNSLFSDIFSGHSPFKGSLYIPDPGDNDNPDEIELSMSSSLQGLQINLPEPFNKPSDSIWSSNFEYNENDKSLIINIKNKIELDFSATDEQPYSLRYIGLGNYSRESGAVQDDRLTVVGQIDKLPVSDWLARYQELFPSKQGTMSLSDLPDIDIAINKLDWNPWPATDVHLVGVVADSGYNLEVKSSHASGVIVLPNDQDEPVIANFTSLTLPDAGGEDASEFDLRPGDLPPVTFSTKVLHTKHVSLKDVGFSIVPDQDDVLFNSIVFAAHDMTGFGQGSWRESDSGVMQSTFSFNMESRDLEDTLEDLGFSGSIKKGEGTAELEFHWEGAPYDISVAKLSGKGEVELKKGSIKELDPGAGRLLALVNLNAITRRLSLDFRDVTNEGFTFDSIRGRFQLAEGGELTTKKIKIKSSAADIRISGSTNIIDQTYNQTVSVIPTISVALPAAGAIVGGPVGAAAGVVADRLARFIGLNKVVEYDYEITGTWKDPVINKVTSREVEVPHDISNSGGQPSGVQQLKKQ